MEHFDARRLSVLRKGKRERHVKPHLPQRGHARVNEGRHGDLEQLKELQPGRRRSHQLAIGSEQVLAFEALDDLGTRGRCADTFGLPRSSNQACTLRVTSGSTESHCVDWSNTVRGALIWLGRADPVASMETVRSEDPNRRAHVALLHAWLETIGGGPANATTAAQALALSETREPLREAIAELDISAPTSFSSKSNGPHVDVQLWAERC